MVDAVDLLLDERSVQTLVELARGGEVASERLLDDHAYEGPGCLRGEPGLVQAFRERYHRLRRGAEVEEAVAAGATFTVDGFEDIAKRLEPVAGIVVVGHVAQARRER